jgi:PAS domain S-box-containing protein
MNPMSDPGLSIDALARAAGRSGPGDALLLGAAFEAIPEGVLIGDVSGPRYGNPAALALLGVDSLQELPHDAAGLGRKFRLRLGRDAEPVDADALPYARALRGEACALATWATRPHGGDVCLRQFAAPLTMGGETVGVLAVLTEATSPEAPTQASDPAPNPAPGLELREQELHALVQGVRDYAIFTLDPQGRIASWHAGAQLMKGYSAEEAIGMPFAMLFSEADRRAGRPELEMRIAAETGEYKEEGRRVRKNGETFEAAIVLTALRSPQGELLGYLKLTQDITRRREQEREREELLRIAKAARADAERLSRSMAEFLATVSHELRTPLGAILGWVQVLQRDSTNRDSLALGLAAIMRNARMQAALIEDLLDMNRIETGQLRLELQPVDLVAVIRNAVEAILPSASAKGIRLQTMLDAAPPAICGDPARLHQVVWNLLTNAVKFTARGATVRVGLLHKGDRLEVSVSDTGQGVEPAFLPRVFDRFQQQDVSTTRRHGGLGLGLTIVRELVHLHGGSVHAQSDGPGRGATFSVALPVPNGGAAAAAMFPGTPAAT